MLMEDSLTTLWLISRAVCFTLGTTLGASLKIECCMTYPRTAPRAMFASVGTHGGLRRKQDNPCSMNALLLSSTAC